MKQQSFWSQQKKTRKGRCGGEGGAALIRAQSSPGPLNTSAAAAATYPSVVPQILTLGVTERSTHGTHVTQQRVNSSST